MTDNTIPPESPSVRGSSQEPSENAVVGGMLALASEAWRGSEQEGVNSFFRYCLKMLQDEMAEKAQTIIEIMARLDMHDEQIAQRVKSSEFQSLVRTALRDWAGAESEAKRGFVRNTLAHAGSTRIVSDDIVRLFLDWLKRYSELHLKVVGVIYNQDGITRGEIWEQIGRGPVREDSADADLFRLLIHELSTGRVIRQHRETNLVGEFMRKQPQRRAIAMGQSRKMVSAFDDNESYELTQLGQQFVHYAMTDIPPKIEFKPETFASGFRSNTQFHSENPRHV